MSRKHRTFKAIKKTLIQISKQFLSTIQKQIIWLLRTFVVTGRKRSSVNAGFVLPTVAMVALVVVLLTTAILFRSFERSKNASNVRVNEAALNAATPAIDRARAKLNKLFQDGQLPRATPTDDALYSTLTTNINEYTFGDETQLKLALSKDETDDTKFLKTAWQYPVDTDNNGKFDSYTLYGIYFKNPPISGGAYNRARNSLEARTPPMTAGSVNGDCGDTLGTSATLVGSTGWFNIGGKLKKAFFAYTATVPITTEPTSAQAANYEKYKGNKGFSAIEYQQERVQLPLVNNAVIYEDDIGLTPGPAFRLNGRIFTNSNFLTASPGSGVTLYQVSSKASCFYEEDNGKIILGGNLGAGGFTDASDLSNTTKVHLYKGKNTDPDLTPEVTANKSVTGSPNNLAYNSLAYVQRINHLVNAQIATTDPDPQEVIDGITEEKSKLGLESYTPEEEEELRRQQLERYFKRRTRRVPYAEVPFNSALSVVLGTYETTDPLEGSGDTLRPPDAWIYPIDPATGTSNTNLALRTNAGDATKLLPGATEPNKLQKQLEGKEQFLGDRVLMGNNLPELWWNGTSFVGPNPQDTQNITSIVWDDGDGTRTRRTRVEQLADLGATDRDQDWELAAAKIPTSPQDPVGGLRVVTGAGIYLPEKYTVTETSAKFTAAKTATDRIWSDMMPVASQTATQATATSTKDPNIELTDNSNTPYLRMRATVVYHYNVAGYDNEDDEKAPPPIACVSSYYDPTNSTRAKNLDLATIPFNKAAGGASNNGIVYPSPDTASGETTYAAALSYQAQLKYPNGRWVNEPLQKALAKTDADDRTLSERSAIESALCALQILDGTIGSPTNTVIPHGAIMETAFLDARQIKAIHQNQSTLGVETFTNADGVNGDGTVPKANVPSTAEYNLSKEQRQPLEIRTTVLDIDLLRGQTISGGTATATEYLLPNSGIVYATRDDALLDLSATGVNQNTESPVDFKLDPTRRPNAIMLINGRKIWRTQNYRDAEKGLILASNLPVYIKGDFNLHSDFSTPPNPQQEFTTTLLDDWSNFYTRTAAQRNVNFACRSGDARLPNCTVGDNWRPASVLADAVTLLSNNFRTGFRDEGDYDLNNNLGDETSIEDFKDRGFYTNAYVTNAQWYDTTAALVERPAKDIDSDSTNGVQGSSYLNNFVTPVQRRGNFNEYLMEVCLKLPVSKCEPGDWKVTTTANSWNITGGIVGKIISDLDSGTTAVPPAAAAYKRFPRRVAFKRDISGNLVLDGNTPKRPTPLGIDGSGNVAEFPYSAGTYPRLAANALWFRTTTDAGNPTNDPSDKEPPDKHLLLSDIPTDANLLDQPRLQAILQINTPFGTPQEGGDGSLKNTIIGPDISNNNYHNNWLQLATETTFNLAAAAGDTPARPTEDNGGLHNFVRFLENWNPTGTTGDAIKARISGSFIQFKRSAYATGPFRAFLTTGGTYPINGNANKAPFYLAPTRQWGYDVGLLSQSPDLFAQKLVRIPDDLPDEFFREVGRDDAWVKTLLCAKKSDDTYAIDEDQRRCD
ncbi:MAG: hormogonium polysaccharide biosynthesis protein HpsA [Komarekiella atlantica HA4396-MV6]|jgi:type II secretory pathway pseudopilin PulG|nr:hormogonium polysaccharide biosynthesis protein HpsA [Komarekiella atlantica HA4396-MV6]